VLVDWSDMACLKKIWPVTEPTENTTRQKKKSVTVALEHIELSSAFDYGGLAVLRDAWERFAMVVESRKLSNLCGSNTARVGEGRVRQGSRCTAVSFEIETWPPNQR
jgi:hypothetical protein